MGEPRTTEPTTAEERVDWLAPLPQIGCCTVEIDEQGGVAHEPGCVVFRLIAHVDTLEARERALTEALKDTEVMLCRVLHEVTAMSHYSLLDAVQKCDLRARALLSGQPPARDAELERLREWLPVIEEARRQDERWLKLMPELPSEQAVFAWALKAQEELGEMSAALLGRLIKKDGRGDPLTECYQTIAVLMRIAKSLTSNDA